MNSLGRVFLAMLSVGISAAAQQTPPLHVDWDKVLLVSKTSATLQVVVNPLLRRGSPIHDPGEPREGTQ
jgi:hypothetical protein